VLLFVGNYVANGPESKIGQITFRVDIPRPQTNGSSGYPSYYGLRSEMICFLNQQKRIKENSDERPLRWRRNIVMG